MSSDPDEVNNLRLLTSRAHVRFMQVDASGDSAVRYGGLLP